MAEVTVDENRL